MNQPRRICGGDSWAPGGLGGAFAAKFCQPLRTLLPQLGWAQLRPPSRSLPPRACPPLAGHKGLAINNPRLAEGSDHPPEIPSPEPAASRLPTGDPRKGRRETGASGPWVAIPPSKPPASSSSQSLPSEGRNILPQVALSSQLSHL